MSTLDIDIVVVSVVVIAIELVVDNVVAVIAIELVDNAVVVIAIELVDNVVVVIAIELVDTIVLVVMVVVMATELVTSDVLVKLISTHCTNCLDLVLVPVYRLLPFPHLVTVHSCPSGHSSSSHVRGRRHTSSNLLSSQTNPSGQVEFVHSAKHAAILII